jgi:hypothetical protein
MIFLRGFSEIGYRFFGLDCTFGWVSGNCVFLLLLDSYNKG